MNLPVSQFYHVSVDNAEPYHVYGGLQDNSSWVGDSSYPGGVTNSRWENMFGGDGFWTWEDPSDPNYIYAEAQGGEIGRVNRYTHETRSIKPYPHYGEKKLRFNWNTPIQMSPNEKGTIYIGAQFLFRSRDHGQSWERISPDLTTNDPEKQKQEESGGVTVDNSAAEMHTTIYSISESPQNGQLIWVGTDDGNVQITRDGGKTWTNVIGNVTGVGKSSWVSWVEAGRFAEGTAYATFDRHMYGDMKPYALQDHRLRQDLDRAARAAERRARLRPRHQGRHAQSEPALSRHRIRPVDQRGWRRSAGRSTKAATSPPSRCATSWCIRATSTWCWPRTDAASGSSTTSRRCARSPGADGEGRGLPPVPPAVQWMETNGGWAEGDATFTGPSRPTEAFIPYYQSARHIYGDLKIEILDQDGKLVDTVPTSKHRGVSRATWSMHLKPPRVPPAATRAFGAAHGPRVLPGIYTVKMTAATRSTPRNSPWRSTRAPSSPWKIARRSSIWSTAGRACSNHMSWAVDAILAVRDGAHDRALRNLPRTIRCAARLQRSGRRSRTRSAPRSSPPRKAARSPAKSASANSWPASTATSTATKAAPPTPRSLAPTPWLANWKT